MAAVDHGADAVYIGAQRFGARAAAGNSVEDIASLCRYAHKFAVKVYVTVNTILYDEELDATEKLVWQLYEAGVDALIVQDLALLKMNLPPIPLHASTQMDNRTPEQVQWLADMGYSQVVLARECSLDQIRLIHETVPQIPLEAFVHGALCVSYSGRCQASQFCFSRSANRGQCAQFCRLPFSLVDAEGKVLAKEKYLLSLRDMNRTASLEKMMDAGIRSFKIEGRLKDVSYVKNVTAWYRRRIDEILRRRPEYGRAALGTVELNFQPNPQRSFSRGFTEYFLHERTKMASFHTPKSMGQDVGVVKEVRGGCIIVSSVASFANGDGLCYLDSEGKLKGFRVNRADGNHLYPAEPVNIRPRTPLYRSFDQEWERMMARPTAVRTLSVEWTISDVEEGFCLKLKREDGVWVERTFPWEHQLAKTDQTTNIEEQLSKLGDTAYRSSGVQVCFSDSWFIPRSQLAAWRREVVELMDAELPKRQSQSAEMRIARPSASIKSFNVSNSLSENVYKASGISAIQQAIEVKPSSDVTTLMECRYCLRNEMGLCPKSQNKHADYKLPLFLLSQDGKRFQLKFDCVQCKMYVMSDGKMSLK
jgi:putative protease